jgi:hypothetical protein
MAKRKKRSRKKKQFNPALAKKKLHSLWSVTVRTRDRYACQWCLHDGKRNVSLTHHAHHIVPRSICGNNGSFDVDNGVTLCYPCHLFRLKSEVDEYIEFRNKWLQENIGVDYPWLREKFSPPIKFTEEFYETKKDGLEFVLKEAGGYGKSV